MAWKMKADTSVNAEIKGMDDNIKQVELQRNKLVFALGEEFLKENRNNSNLADNYKQKIDIISKLDYNRKVWENRKLKAQGMRTCECGNLLPFDSFFCNKCGVKLSPVAEELVIIPSTTQQ